jgi:nucleoside-diphosphate-sugar epimerase
MSGPSKSSLRGKVTAMKRRDFLQATSLAVARGTGALAGQGRTKGVGSDSRSEQASSGLPPAKVLITSAQTELGQAIAVDLGPVYRVRLTGPVDFQTEYEYVKALVDHEASTRRLVRGVSAIVHLGPPATDTDEAERIDYATRGTYNLLRAAAEEGVRRVVYLSSLGMMTGYREDFEVDEDWRPLAAPGAGALPEYLGEFTCREFARQQSLSVIVLRLGEVRRADEPAEKPISSCWVHPRDVTQAIRHALAALLAGAGPRVGNWSIFHIQVESPRARFSVGKAKRVLGYQSRFGGEEP